MSFVFSFIYLFFFRTTVYFGLPYPPAHTNMIQMILTLKMVGLAFEMNAIYNKKKEVSQNGSDAKENVEEYVLGLEDFFHYGFNYIGVLAGNKSFFL